MLLLSFIIFLYGCVIGSFLNVLADRFARNESVVKGRSYCESCKKTLGLLDLIPIFSFLFLRGRCRYCKKKLSWYYPVVEITTGALFVFTFWWLQTKFPISNSQFPLRQSFSEASQISNIIYYISLISSLIVIFFADIKYGVIPDKILFPAIVVSLLYLLFAIPHLFFSHFLSAIAAFLFFFLIFFLTRGKGMGFGDVKFAFLIGLVLGFPNIIIAFYIAFLTGALISLILIAGGKKKLRGSTIPFGPFIVFGMFIALYFGEYIQQLSLFQFLH